MGKKKIYFRCDGKHSMGLGHIYRSLALSQMLSSKFEAQFIIHEGPEDLLHEVQRSSGNEVLSFHNAGEFSQLPDISSSIVVLDGYQFDTEYQKEVKPLCKALASIDDLHQSHFVSDLVINHGAGAKEEDYSCESYTKLLLGPHYVLLREAFRTNRRTNFNQLPNVFICFGGSDIHGLSVKSVQAVIESGLEASINVVVGESFEHMAQLEDLTSGNPNMRIHSNLDDQKMFHLISMATVTIVPSSGISYEACSVKTPIISGYYIENQLDILKGLEDLGCIHSIGDFRTVTVEELAEAIKFVSDDLKTRFALVRMQTSAFDGRSDKRLLKAFRSL